MAPLDRRQLMRWLGAASLAAAPAARAADAQAQTTELTFFGQSAFRIVTPRGTVMLIDPWLANPLNAAGSQARDLERVDYLLITHGHFDHVGEAVAIGERTGAKLVANFELGGALVRHGGYPAAQAGYDTLLNIGGSIAVANGEVRVTMVPAVHSSGMTLKDRNGQEVTADGGTACGFVIAIDGGPTIYHSGDTAYFADMRWIGQRFKPDVALLNIGGHFGMEVPDAVLAARALQPRVVIPHHFGTFPILTARPDAFFAALDHHRIAHREMRVGERLALHRRGLA
jgi:L-ascorbate metabolism protein UlaG (beta-lactamase superfamily)